MFKVSRACLSQKLLRRRRRGVLDWQTRARSFGVIDIVAFDKYGFNVRFEETCTSKASNSLAKPERFQSRCGE